jgi:hypothetical protein
MTSVPRTILSFGLLAILVATLPSCSSAVKGEGGVVKKMKTYHLQPTERLVTRDPAIVFERAYHLHGAVTMAEQMERAGHYYTFFWKVNDRTQPVTVRFEYRQANTGLVVKLKEEQISNVRRNNITKFSVTGPEYQADGAITAWRLTLMSNGQELVHADSFLWK